MERIVSVGAGNTGTKVVDSLYSKSRVCAPDKRFKSCKEYLSVKDYCKVVSFCKRHINDDGIPNLPVGWGEWERYHFDFIWWRVRKYGV